MSDFDPSLPDPATADARPRQRGRLYDGTVLSIRGQITIVHSEGFELPCEVRRRFRTGRRAIAVGDHVRFARNEDVTDGVEGVIEEVLPRRSQLARKLAGKMRKEQVIVANVDQVLIVVCLGLPKANLGFVDRVLVGASYGNLEGVLCLNKIDLQTPEDDAFVAELDAVYNPLGVPTVRTSATTGQGIDELKKLLQEKVSVLSGASGCGKSSLLNALQPGLKLRTGQISEKWGKGRHSTTWSSLLYLQFGGFVVDTPGMREFGLHQLEPRTLADHFPELRERAPACKFGDCLHTVEPACAVQEGLELGEIAASRYASYRRILADLQEEASQA